MIPVIKSIFNDSNDETGSPRTDLILPLPLLPQYRGENGDCVKVPWTPKVFFVSLCVLLSHNLPIYIFPESLVDYVGEVTHRLLWFRSFQFTERGLVCPLTTFPVPPRVCRSEKHWSGVLYDHPNCNGRTTSTTPREHGVEVIGGTSEEKPDPLAYGGRRSTSWTRYPFSRIRGWGKGLTSSPRGLWGSIEVSDPTPYPCSYHSSVGPS